MPSLPRALLVSLVLCAAACRTSNLGACKGPADCPSGSICDTTQESPVCVASEGGCFPACADGRSCQASVCVQTACSPACGAGQVCDLANFTCGPVGSPLNLTLQTDGRVGPVLIGGTVATVRATVEGGSGTGVVPSSVQLAVAGHAALVGAPGSGGLFTFTVPIDDALVAPGTSATVPFQLSAKDSAGHTVTLAGDPREVIRVDRDAPQFSLISVTTSADYTDATGRKVFNTSGGPLAVVATIGDPSGVDPVTVCLRLTGETKACAHSGTAGSGNTWNFSLARPAAPSDGVAPATFTLAASDKLAVSAVVGQAEHQGTSAAQSVYFDNRPPSISIFPDTAAYARTLADGGVDLLTISALITEPNGVVSPQLLSANSAPVAPSFVDGGYYAFQLDAAAAPAGAQGAYGFTVRAKDGVGNQAQVSGTRLIDDAPPAAAVKVFEGSEPSGTGTTYPAFAANTGHTGALFVYSDTVHLKGTLSDPSGVGAVSYHVDGLELDGGVSAGVSHPLPCSPGAGATACSFDVQVALNDPQNGAFHTGTGTVAFDGGTIPAGNLNLVIHARDLAVGADGVPAPHAGATGAPAATTRLLWQATLANPATGLAVHPSGDLIATTGGSSNGVYALAGDGSTRWTYGSQGLGAVSGPPAIGAGDASSARIYAAGQGGGIYALTPAGAVAWQSDSLGRFTVGPAIATAIVAASVVEQVLVPSNDTANSSRLYAATAVATTSAASDDVDVGSSPVALGGNVFFGTDNGISRHAIGTATPGAAAVFTKVSGPWNNLISDGNRLFGSTFSTFNGAGNGGVVLALDPTALTAPWTNALAVSAAEQPGIGLDGKLLLSLYDSNVESIAPLTGATSTLLAIAGANFARAPLFGSDGHLYLPRSAGYLFAFAGTQLSWQAHPPGTMIHAFTIDCQGLLYTAAGNRVFAYVSDDHGLGDTPWPAYRRDTRNTGNTEALRYGVRTAAGCTQ